MTKEILFLTTMFPDVVSDFYNEKMFVSGDENITFIQQSLIEGFEKNEDVAVSIINKTLISKQEDYRVPEKTWISEKGKRGVSFSYINKPLFSSNLLFGYTKKHIDKWLLENEDTEKSVIAYALTEYSLKALSYIKKKNPKIKTGLIVPDLPEYTKIRSSNPLINIKNSITNRHISKSIKKSVPYIDSFMLFSKHMAKPLGCEEKYIVFEGLATDNFSGILPERIFDNSKKIILYGGGLHEKYGLKLLCDAFSLIKDEEYRLVLCGTGSFVPEIERRAKEDSRISYLGRVPREKLLAYQAGADLLVNPRTSAQIFSDYSFPSKNMEYLSSGVPFVGFKLGGIPDEYDCFINYSNDEMPENLAKTMIETLSVNRAEAVNKASLAKEYVLAYKNKEMRAKEILSFMNKG